MLLHVYTYASISSGQILLPGVANEYAWLKSFLATATLPYTKGL